MFAHFQRDNVIVSLPFHYDADELDRRIWSARAAMYVTMACLVLNAFSFFGGFSTFDIGMSLFRACLQLHMTRSS